MKVQRCAPDPITPAEKAPRDALCRMISMNRDVQRALGIFDERLSDLQSNSFIMPKMVVYQLDCASQEASEAWDLIEGGWKGHKTNPDPTDIGELLMEIVDAFKYCLNAYLFMGGQPEEELVAGAVNRSSGSLAVPRLGMGELWGLGTSRWIGEQRVVNYGMFGYDHAHGEEWEKSCAAMVNRMRSRISSTADTIREFPRGHDIPAASGFIVMETFDAVLAAASGIPGVGQGEFYRAFVQKHDIVMKRIDNGY